MLSRLFAFVFLLSANVFASPNIVVSIKPIHSIVSLLTQGITTPKLLFENNQSPHHSHLKPSQLSLLSRADLIIIIHPEFEAGFKKTLMGINPSKKFIINSDSITRHSWLEVEFMQIFAKKLTQKLIEIDKTNTDIYQTNLTQVVQKLKQLKQDISKQLAPYKNRPIAAYADTFKYFVQSNHLQNPVLISKSHGDRLSIYKIRIAKNAMQKAQTKCLLSTTTIPNKRLGVLSEGLDMNVAMIDVMGAQNPIGIQHYFKLMRNITQQIALCLG